jgi:hypothetical protein
MPLVCVSVKPAKCTYFLLSMKVEVNIALRAPAQAANVVLTATKAATSPRFSDAMESVEPGLNPYQPNQRQKVPSICSDVEWAVNSAGSSSRSPFSSWKRPILGPRMMAATRAVTPPVIWTGPDPAKSMTPIPKSGLIAVLERNPLYDQWA